MFVSLAQGVSAGCLCVSDQPMKHQEIGEKLCKDRLVGISSPLLYINVM